MAVAGPATCSASMRSAPSRALPFGPSVLMQLRPNHSNTSTEVVLRLSIIKRGHLRPATSCLANLTERPRLDRRAREIHEATFGTNTDALGCLAL
jgi:hypothetical protein